MTSTDWLFMVYLSGDNNLSSEMAWAINEIGEIYEQNETLQKRILITIQYDSLSPSPWHHSICTGT